MGVPGVVRGSKDVGDPLVCHVPVLSLDKLVEAGISFVFVDGVRYNIVHLTMSICVCEILIIVNFELFVGIFYQSESFIFETADSDPY